MEENKPKNLILFGAGASFGSDIQGTPPLGSQGLFIALTKSDPDGWGMISGDLSKLFQNNFDLKGYFSEKFDEFCLSLEL